jgi:hypothetical protein
MKKPIKSTKSLKPCQTKTAKCKSVDPTKSTKCSEHKAQANTEAAATDNPNPYLEVVLGGGGIKGYSHFGVQKYLDENKIKVDAYLGISVGSIVATLLTNGYSWEAAKAVFDYELNKANKDALINTMSTPCPVKFVFGRLFGSRSNKISMTFLAQHMVTKYKLKPQPNLRILAYDRKSDSSIVFEGTDYNLVKALAGSCSIPGVVHPVVYQGNELDAVLLDGQLTSYTCGVTGSGTVIHSRLGYATKVPKEIPSLGELLFHLAEVQFSSVLSWFLEKKVPGHFLIEAGMPSVSCLNFKAGKRIRDRMVDYGYQQATRTLRNAVENNTLPTYE